MILKTEFSQPKHLHFRGNTRIFALFFMVLDLRLVKIGCRDDNQFFLLPTLPAPRHVLAYTPSNRLFVRALHAAHETARSTNKGLQTGSFPPRMSPSFCSPRPNGRRTSGVCRKYGKDRTKITDFQTLSDRLSVTLQTHSQRLHIHGI